LGAKKKSGHGAEKMKGATPGGVLLREAIFKETKPVERVAFTRGGWGKGAWRAWTGRGVPHRSGRGQKKIGKKLRAPKSPNSLLPRGENR